jgi:hypothetical protein
MDVTVRLGSERDERLRLNGSTAGRPGREPRTYREGRVCDADGCETLLSRYNRSDLCWQHEPLRAYLGPVRGRRPRQVEVVDDLSTLSA